VWSYQNILRGCTLLAVCRRNQNQQAAKEECLVVAFPVDSLVVSLVVVSREECLGECQEDLTSTKF
jgi:hypothetical protein